MLGSIVFEKIIRTNFASHPKLLKFERDPRLDRIIVYSSTRSGIGLDIFWEG